MNADSLTSPAGPPTQLLTEFPAPTAGAWRAAAEALLKGAPFEKKLITPTPEGIALQPIYRAEDLESLPVDELPGFGSRRRGAGPAGHVQHGWDISQELPLATAEEFNAAALHDLARGQSELNLLCDHATGAGRDPDEAAAGEVGAGGLSLATLEDIDCALANVHLPMVSIYLRAGAGALPAAALLLAHARKRGIPPQELRGCIEVDPLARLAGVGALPGSLRRAYDEMASLLHYALAHAPHLQTVAVTTHAWHDAGASAVQELAIALATGVDYLRALADRGITAERAAPHLRFAVGVGSNHFMEIAKLRALRVVWAQVVRALGGSDAATTMHLHVRTARFNKTVYDTHTNILRGTNEAFAAVIGGCDSLHVAPYNEVLGVPDELGRRIARNTQIILAEECDLARVIDPAGGSYYVEWLTNEVASHAWELFQNIEKAGGMARALAGGLPQKLVADTAKNRAEAVARRRTVIVGTNQYPNHREQAPARPLPDLVALQRTRAEHVSAFRAAFAPQPGAGVLKGLAALLTSAPAAAMEAATVAALQGATLGAMARAMRAGDEAPAAVSPVNRHRAAEPFERLRDAAGRWKQQRGHPPLLFQANIGPSRLYRLRADWTTGFFEVAGFQVAADRDFTDAGQAVTAALESAAEVVVITAADETYPSVVEPVARALKTRNPSLIVLVAGLPKENEAPWRAAGIDDFVNITSNALELLTRLLVRIGVLS